VLIFHSALSFNWADPEQRLAALNHGSPATFERNLRDDFSGLATMTNQSNGRAIISVTGPKTRQMLAKGTSIDLDPSAFSSGDTALTVAAHINVPFWELDDTPHYEFVEFHSYAPAFLEWLLSSAAKFGVSIDDPA
jgi:heterotetrameric sarcosine oxidase gamma subunit